MVVFELPLAAAKLFILAGLSACPQGPSPKVDVKIVTKDNPYVTNLSAKDLTNGFGSEQRQRETLGEHATTGRWMTGGLAMRELHSQVSGTFAMLKDRKSGDICMSIKTLTYTLTHEATIYVASDYKNMGCRHSQTMAHERKHVQFDRLALNQHVPALKQAVAAYARKAGPQGPFPQAQADAHMQIHFDAAVAAARPAIERMKTTMAEYHARIDNYDNYKKESALCPGQFPEFDGTPATGTHSP